MRILSDEWKEKISKSLRGNTNAKDHVVSEETKQRWSVIHKENWENTSDEYKIEHKRKTSEKMKESWARRKALAKAKEEEIIQLKQRVEEIEKKQLFGKVRRFIRGLP